MDLMKLVPLLKYLNRDAITPEAVVELAALAGRVAPPEEAAEVSKVFKTRGQAGLLPLAAKMLSWPKADPPTSEAVVFECPHCHRFFDTTLKEIKESINGTV